MCAKYSGPLAGCAQWKVLPAKQSRASDTWCTQNCHRPPGKPAAFCAGTSSAANTSPADLWCECADDSITTTTMCCTNEEWKEHHSTTQVTFTNNITNDKTTVYGLPPQATVQDLSNCVINNKTVPPCPENTNYNPYDMCMDVTPNTLLAVDTKITGKTARGTQRPQLIVEIQSVREDSTRSPVCEISTAPPLPTNTAMPTTLAPPTL